MEKTVWSGWDCCVSFKLFLSFLRLGAQDSPRSWLAGYAAMASTTPNKVKWSSTTLSSTIKPTMTADLYILNNLASLISTNYMPSRRKTDSWRGWFQSMKSFWGIGCLPHRRWWVILWKLAVPFWIWTMLVFRHFTKVFLKSRPAELDSLMWVCSERLCQSGQRHRPKQLWVT